MPLYEYRCQSCGRVFEVRQSFSDDPITTHDGCGGQVERIISAPALQFKGSGWYITDYAKGANAPAQPKGAESKSEAPSSSDKPASSEKPASSDTSTSSEKK